MLSIILLLNIFIVCKKPKPELIPIGEEKAVAFINDGQIKWAEGIDQKGQYVVITRAFFLRSIFAFKEVSVLRLELKKCRESKER